MSAKKPPSLYRVLGLRKTATTEEIARAYRRLALKHHPDRGGDRQRFEAIHAAFEVLSDPDRRARYDATGDTGALVDNTLADLAGVLTPLLTQILQRVVAQGDDPAQVDLLKILKGALDDQAIKAGRRANELRKARDKVLDAAGRFEAAGETNLLAEVARQQARQVEAQLAAEEAVVAKLARARKYLDGVRYRLDAGELRRILVYPTATFRTV